MSTRPPEQLYHLLPAIYRMRDAKRGEVLRALTGILQEPLDCVEEDILQQYRNWFVETGAEWVLPYIADLLGVRTGHSFDTTTPDRPVQLRAPVSQRAYVANTLSYRRRKGTLGMIDDLAYDSTGWGAHAVEFFELLGWTQHLNHLRRKTATNPSPSGHLNTDSVTRVGTVNLRELDALQRIDTAFDEVAHTVDVRPMSRTQGWHNIENLGVFLWRLQSYPLLGTTAKRSSVYTDGFHFSVLGAPAPLFTNPDRRSSHVPTKVPQPIDHVSYFFESDRYYGGDENVASFALYRGDEIDEGQMIDPAEVLCKDLSDWSPPSSGRVAVDVRLGRVAFAPGEAPDQLTVSHYYGFSGDVGGGPYNRRDTIVDPRGDSTWFSGVVAKHQTTPPTPGLRHHVADAVNDWIVSGLPNGVITILDNGTYEEDIALTYTGAQRLVIQAANEARPQVRWMEGASLGRLRIGGGGSEEGELQLSGLLMEGGVHVAAESLGKLRVTHSTLVPGWELDESDATSLHPDSPSVDVDVGNPRLEVVLEASISGWLRLPTELTQAALYDTIVDRPETATDPRVALAADASADEPAPPSRFFRCTFLGEVHVKRLDLATDCLFVHRVFVERTQVGCVRFSYVDPTVSQTPRRFRCQPDLALEYRRERLGVTALPAAEVAAIRSAVRPDFTSFHYHDPAYAQLYADVAEQIWTGSELGVEMGAFEHLRQAHREANLRDRLTEYVPYGLDAELIFIT